MTILAPLNTIKCLASPDTVQNKLKGITALIAALTIAGCASNGPANNTLQANPELAAISAEAAAATTDATTPSVRLLGTTADRKLALQRLAQRSIRTDNPGTYTVVKGDTLWDISERFLSRPWLWPEIWQVNPQIENPHLIYPGDQVSLTYVDGQPQLQLIRAASRTGSLTGNRSSSPISNLPADGLQPFLVAPEIVSANELNRAPYVVATEDDRLIASIGNHIYARGEFDESRYSIYRPGKALIDPETEKVIGHEAIHVSQASLVKSGDPSKLVITSNTRETLVGDRLMPKAPAANLDFQPRMADTGKSGRIISLVDALARVGQNQVVVLDLGEEDGMQPGDVLSVFGNDRVVKDNLSGRKNDPVTIDGEKAGVVMVFRTFESASYALVVRSEKTINLHDRVGGI